MPRKAGRIASRSEMSPRWHGTPSTGLRLRATRSKTSPRRARTAPPIRPLMPVTSTRARGVGLSTGLPYHRPPRPGLYNPRPVSYQPAMDYRDYRHLLFERRDNGVVAITINRPEVMNATNARLHWELTQVWLTVDADPRARVALITGAGKA